MATIKVTAIEDQAWTLGMDYELPVTLMHNGAALDVTLRTSRLRFKNQATGATFERTNANADWIVHTTPASGIITLKVAADPQDDNATSVPAGIYVVDFRSEAAGENVYYDSAVWTFETPAVGLYS